MSLPEEVGVRVQVDSSTRMAWGSSPLVLLAQCQNVHEPVTYINEGLLALDTDLQGIPAHLDVEVLAFVLCFYGDGDVDILDGLVPLVRQRGLLGLFLRASLVVGLLSLFWRG
jgi:hypothetical protein